MTASQFWIYMLTLVLAPLIAVQVSEFINQRREVRGRRIWIFRTLMATRASRVSLDHVQALNMIDMEFHGADRKSQSVLKAWKAYLNHLNTKAPPDVWLSKSDDLFVDLLYEMALSLGYSMDKTDIRSTSYFPEAHGAAEISQAQIREGLKEVLEGTRAIVIEPRNPGQT